LTVTDEPAVQNVGAAPTVVNAEFRAKVVWAPGSSVKVSVTKVRGLFAAGVPAGPPSDQTPPPPEEMEQGESQDGGLPDPVSVPTNTTWHEEGVQGMGFPPSFLIDMAMATGEPVTEDPALADAPTTTMLVLLVALSIRLYTDAVTTPPTPRTAAMIMKRSMLCEIPLRRDLVFNSQLGSPII